MNYHVQFWNFDFLKLGKWNFKNSFWNLSSNRITPIQSNNFNFTMRKKIKSGQQANTRKWFDNGGRHGGFPRRKKVSCTHAHACIHTSLKRRLWEGKVSFSHLCALLHDRESDPHHAPRHLCTRASLAHTDSVTDPRILSELLAPQEGMMRGWRINSSDVQETDIALFIRKSLCSRSPVESWRDSSWLLGSSDSQQELQAFQAVVQYSPCELGVKYSWIKKGSGCRWKAPRNEHKQKQKG